MKLRYFQSDLKAETYASWHAGKRNVGIQLATGGGKTALFSNIMSEWAGPSIAIAHRAEIVSQISLTLARYGVEHRIVGPQSLSNLCITLQRDELKTHYINPSSRSAVASVDTLRRFDPSDKLLQSMSLCVVDEAHHCLRDNKWGQVVGMMPNAYGLFPSATWARADGKGLGRHAQGLVDVLHCGPGMRTLIDQKFLTDYRVFCIPNDLRLKDVPISAGGDYNPQKLAETVHQSKTIVGDVVAHYLAHCRDMLGITFTVDVAAAQETADAYRRAGVPAEVLTGETHPTLRAAIMRRFRKREILQICNCDILGEGVDVPAVECVSLARPTASLILYMQQFGRALRLMNGKAVAYVLDHVGNVLRHGTPDKPRVWTLDARDRRSGGGSSAIPMRVCLKCTAPFEAHKMTCPYCGEAVIIESGRNIYETQECTLRELTADDIARLNAAIDAPPAFPRGADQMIVAGIRNRHHEKTLAQAELRQAISLWAGYRAYLGDTTDEARRLFGIAFGVDTLSAQALPRAEAETLRDKVAADIEYMRKLL